MTGGAGTRLLAAGAALSLLSACGSPTADNEPPPDDRDDEALTGEWVLVDGEGPEGSDPLAAGETVLLRVVDGEASGQAPCNSFFFETVAVSGREVDFEGAGNTDMDCDGPVMDAERAFLTSLGAVDEFERDGDELRLDGGGATLRFERVEPVSVDEVAGTAWELEALQSPEGDGAERPADLDHSLTLDGEGGWRATGECLELAGTLPEGSDSLRSHSGRVVDGSRCEHGDFRDSEQLLNDVFHARPEVVRDGDRLRLESDEGALVYRLTSDSE